MAPKKNKTITVRVNVTSPFGRPGNMIEVDPEHPVVKHQLSTGYLTEVDAPKPPEENTDGGSQSQN